MTATAHRPADDPAAPINALLARLRPRLSALVAAIGIPERDREDLVQDALVALISQWRVIHDPDRWLLGTLRNRCRRYLRRQRFERKSFAAIDPLQLDLLPDPAAHQDPDLMLDVERLVNALPARQRHLLWSFYRLGLTLSEMSDRPGNHPSATLRKDRWRALAQLRRQLDRKRDDLPGSPP
jgi:RNA polymerase sigma factor (sigma-70 family)